VDSGVLLSSTRVEGSCRSPSLDLDLALAAARAAAQSDSLDPIFLEGVAPEGSIPGRWLAGPP